MNFEFLEHVRVSYVLNAAEGNKPGCVGTNQDYYSSRNIHYMGLKMFDVPQTNIAKFFDEAADFIDDGLKNKGIVLVHCLMGMSRSATLVLAFLMLRRETPILEACKPSAIRF